MRKRCQCSPFILGLSPSLKIVHVLYEVLSLAGLGEDSRSVVLYERGLQATGNVILKVIADVFLKRHKIPVLSESRCRNIVWAVIINN